MDNAGSVEIASVGPRPSIWIVKFSELNKLLKVASPSDQDLAIGQQRSCVENKCLVEIACEAPGPIGWIVELCARGNYAVDKNVGGTPRHQDFPIMEEGRSVIIPRYVETSSVGPDPSCRVI